MDVHYVVTFEKIGSISSKSYTSILNLLKAIDQSKTGFWIVEKVSPNERVDITQDVADHE